MELFEFVGQRLRQLRSANPTGRTYSQESLARALGIAANTVSRWETATYKPSLKDLDRVSRLLSVSILEFFPREEQPKDETFSALLRAARQLEPTDLDELRRFAEFRRAESAMRSKAQNKRRRREPASGAT